MPAFPVAHVCENDEQLVLVLLDASFNDLSSSEQHAMLAHLRYHAEQAGLEGTVVPLWPAGVSTGFIAPPRWHTFFRRPAIYSYAQARINQRLEM